MLKDFDLVGITEEWFKAHFMVGFNPFRRTEICVR